MVSPDDVKAAITSKTILMSFMYANNEVGTINPIADIAAVAAKHGVLFHSDAVQGIGQLPSDMRILGVDLASLTAHKIYGPKGIGALYIRQGISPPDSLFYGGGQELGVRPGTLNVVGIVGLGTACELSKNYMETGKSCVSTLRDVLHEKLTARLEDIHLNGHPQQRLPGNLNLCFAGVQKPCFTNGIEKRCGINWIGM